MIFLNLRRALPPLCAVALSVFLPACHEKTPFTMTAQDNQTMARAIKEDKVQPVIALLDKGMNPNSADATGKPFLVAAVEAGDSDLVYTFLSHSVIVDITDENGLTALMAAAIGKHSDIVTLLLDRQAKVNLAITRGEHLGMTPLHFAAERSDVDILLKLLKQGALPNAQDAKGRTPLMLAAASEHEQAVELLLIKRPDITFNADLTLRDAAGKTALNYAQSKRDTAIIARLKQAGAKE